MNRQLYQGGGIMSLSKEGIGGGDYKGIDMGSRVGYGIIKKVFRGAKKAVKGAAGAVKDIASSDIGKAALLAGAGMYAGGLGPFASGARFGNVAGAGFLPNLFTGAGIGASTVADGLTAGVGPKRSLLSNLFSKIPGGGVTAAIGGASILSGLLTKAQMAEIDEADPDERGDIVAEKLRQSLTRLGVSGQELEDRVAEGVSEYTGYTSKAEGGRIGYQDAGPVLPPDPTQPVNPFGPKPTGPVLPDRMASNMENDKILEALFEKFLDMGLSPEKAAEEAKKEFERMSMMKTEGRGLAALGGRMGFAEAGSAIKDSYDVVEGMDNELNPGLLDKILSSMGVGKFTYGVDEDQGASLIDEIQDYKYGESYPRETISGGKDKYGAVIGPIPKPDRPPMSMEETIEDLEDRWDMAIEEGYEPGKGGEFDYLGIYKKEDIRRRIELGFDQAKASSNSNKIMAAQGGIMNRAGYALGDSASENAMQAAGIEGLPIRQNPKGVKELDLRDNGGFIPPVGIKEKEDDIPAMLSNNEFVFTADAVRGMGDGDVELGAQRMYDQMKMLEKGGRV